MATFWLKTMHFVAVAAIATWCLSDPAFAQRGRGGGNGGGGGQDGGDGGGNKSARSFSGSSQMRSSGSNSQFQASPGGSQFRSSDGGNSTRTFRQNDSPRFSDSNQNQGARTGQSQQSFFRGPNDSDNSPRTANANTGENHGDWRNSVFRDNDNRSRDRDSDKRIGDNNLNRLNFDRDRNDFDRDRFRSDNDRNRFSNDRDDWWRTENRIRDDWRRRDRNDLPFRLGWWDRYRNDRWPVFSPWGYSWWRDRPYYWWGVTPAGRLTSWLVFGWNTPRYWVYGYGPGSNIYYQGDYVYYDNQQYLPVADYYRQIYGLARNVPAIDPKAAETMEWAPLGVFAALRNANESDANQRTMQLAVNKDGVIAGTYLNQENGKVRPLSGKVDDHNQRAAWAFADGENAPIVFETSVFNLTRNESTMMVHFGPASNQTEVWRLVRLEEPQNSQTVTNQPQPATQNSLP